MHRRRQHIVGLAILLLVAASCQGEAPGGEGGDGNEVIKIGFVNTLSGPVSFLGQAPLEGAELAIDELNESDELQGHRYVLITGDDALDPSKAVSVTQKLISQDDVDVIIGAGHSGSSLATLPITEQAEVPQITPISALDDLTEPVHPYFFRLWNKDANIAKTLAEFATETFGEVALLFEDTAFGVGGKDSLLAAMNEIGEEFVAVESYSLEASEITPQIVKVRKAGAEAIVIQGNAPQAALAARNAKQLGYDAPIIGHPGLAQRGLIEVGGEAVEGVIVIDGLDRSKPEAQEFIKKYEDAYGQDPFSFYPALGYDLMYLLTDALVRVDFDVSKLRDGLEETQGFSGVIGPPGTEINYGPDDHDGYEPEALIFKVVKDGELQDFEG